jgi:hypothetical protein
MIDLMEARVLMAAPIVLLDIYFSLSFYQNSIEQNLIPVTRGDGKGRQEDICKAVHYPAGQVFTSNSERPPSRSPASGLQRSPWRRKRKHHPLTQGSFCLLFHWSTLAQCCDCPALGGVVLSLLGNLEPRASPKSGGGEASDIPWV